MSTESKLVVSSGMKLIIAQQTEQFCIYFKNLFQHLFTAHKWVALWIFLWNRFDILTESLLINELNKIVDKYLFYMYKRVMITPSLKTHPLMPHLECNIIHSATEASSNWGHHHTSWQKTKNSPQSTLSTAQQCTGGSWG